MKNALLRLLAAGFLTAGLMACNTDPDDGAGSDTRSIDGVWLMVRSEYAVELIDDGSEIEGEDEYYDTLEFDTADVFSRRFYVIQSGALFGAEYGGPIFGDESTTGFVTRIRSVGGDRWVMGANDTLTIRRNGGKLTLEKIYTPDEGMQGSIKTQLVAYKGDFPPAEWYMDPEELYEPDDARSQAKSIGTGGSPQTRYLGQDDADWFSFEAVKDQWYDIEIEPDYYLDAYVRLYSANGATSLAADESYISWQAPSSGTYYFRVSNEGEDADFYTATVYAHTEEMFKAAGSGALRKSARPHPLDSVPVRAYGPR